MKLNSTKEIISDNNERKLNQIIKPVIQLIGYVILTIAIFVDIFL